MIEKCPIISILTCGSPGVLNVQILQASVWQRGCKKIMRTAADGAGSRVQHAEGEKRRGGEGVLRGRRISGMGGGEGRVKG